jgi:transcriptional regulator with XRE-family HTH domain
MSNVGDVFKELRGKRSFREVSRGTGISHSYLVKLEAGIDPRSGREVKPSREVLRKLSDYYDYPYEKLLHQFGYINEATVDAIRVDHVKRQDVKMDAAATFLRNRAEGLDNNSDLLVILQMKRNLHVNGKLLSKEDRIDIMDFLLNIMANKDDTE